MALVALIVSAAAFLWTVVWSVWLYRRSTRPRLDVDAGFGVAALPLQTLHCFSVTATNTGDRRTTINSIDIEIKDAHGFLVLYRWNHQSGPLPAALEPGDQWSALVDSAEVHEGLREASKHGPPWHFRTHVRHHRRYHGSSDWITVERDRARPDSTTR